MDNSVPIKYMRPIARPTGILVDAYVRKTGVFAAA
jgi:hypothetical protein